MSANIWSRKGGAITVTIGAPGWVWKLGNVRAQVMCALAYLRALELEDQDAEAADAISRVLMAVKNELEGMSEELMPPEFRS